MHFFSNLAQSEQLPGFMEPIMNRMMVHLKQNSLLLRLSKGIVIIRVQTDDLVDEVWDDFLRVLHDVKIRVILPWSFLNLSVNLLMQEIMLEVQVIEEEKG